MNRSTALCVPLATLPLLTLTLSTAAQAAEPGFYFGATASRVEHDIEGYPGELIAIANPTPTPIFPPGGGVTPRPIPGDPIFVDPIFVGPAAIDIDEVDAGFSLMVGYRINRYLAAELSYTDFGEYQRILRFPLTFPTISTQISVRGPSVAVLGSLPLGEQWELFLRAGVLFADQEVSTSANSTFERDFSDEVAMGGAGVQWSFATRWTARLEYQRSGNLQYGNTAGESSIDQASLSVLFKL